MSQKKEKTEIVSSPSTAIEVEDTHVVSIKKLAANAKPVVPYDKNALFDEDYYYPTFTEKRCSICTSPHRELIERVYLANNKNASAVQRFFLEHYRAKITWEAIATHMKNHVDLTQVQVSGIVRYGNMDEHMAKWKYRERDLALNALLTELDHIGGWDVGQNADLRIKKAQLVDKLSSSIMRVQKEREENALEAFDPFRILSEIFEELPDAKSREIVKNKLMELRSKLEQIDS